MNSSSNIQEREQWRARILRALAELRSADEGRLSPREERRDDDAGRDGT